jgi:hypothetical protein
LHPEEFSALMPHFIIMYQATGLWVRAGLRFLVTVGLVGLGLWRGATVGGAAGKTENVFLIVSDGLRWQEVFRGAEEALVSTNGAVRDLEGLKSQFWRETPQARREALFPFLWGGVAKRGQLYGNRDKGSLAKVLNSHRFSYPGYSEMLTGSADPRIDSNDRKPNPNITVFEWLDSQSQFKGRTAVFATWNVFPYIFNIERNHLPIFPHWEARFQRYGISISEDLKKFMRDTNAPWHDVTFDSFVFHGALDYVKQKRPRLIFLGFGETDEWAHSGRYDVYLQAAHHFDDYVKRLWDAVQSIREYRDKTTFVLTTDHGRGNGLTSWKDHGKALESDEIWIGVIGPDTPALGERANAATVTQSQIASTIAKLVGEDFGRSNSKAAGPIADLFQAGTN